jgi:cation transport ATPase
VSLGYGGVLPQSYLDIDVGGWVVWSLEFSISVYVVACPCGIGLAAPTAMFVGTGLAAKYGILARGGGDEFQVGAKVDIVCFDKTGTLTEGGDPKVTNVEYFLSSVSSHGVTSTLLLKLAKEIEGNSAHPLATAVKNYVDDNNNAEVTANIALASTTELAGQGLKSKMLKNEWNISEVIVGNESLMKSLNIDLSSVSQNILGWKQQGKSIILVALHFNLENGQEDSKTMFCRRCPPRSREEGIRSHRDREDLHLD